MGQFITGEAARERIRELMDQVEAAQEEMRELSTDEVGNEFRVELAERLENQQRTNRGLMYRVFGQIADPPDEPGLVPTVVDRLWARLRIPRGEIKRRMKVAARIRPRRQLVGPPSAPQLPVVAEAVESGVLGEDHLRVICRALDVLPSGVSPDDRAEVEASLVREAAKNDAPFVAVVGRRIDENLQPRRPLRRSRPGPPARPAARCAGPGWDVAAGGLHRSGDPRLCGSSDRGGAPGPPPARRHPGGGAR